MTPRVELEVSNQHAQDIKKLAERHGWRYRLLPDRATTKSNGIDTEQEDQYIDPRFDEKTIELWNAQRSKLLPMISNFKTETEPAKVVVIENGVRRLVKEIYKNTSFSGKKPKENLDINALRNCLGSIFERSLPEQIPTNMLAKPLPKKIIFYYYDAPTNNALISPDKIAYIIGKHGLDDGVPKSEDDLQGKGAGRVTVSTYLRLSKDSELSSLIYN